MIEYFIIGSGGFAKEVYLHAANVLDKSVHIFKGFIDIKPQVGHIFTRGNKEVVIDEETFFREHLPSSGVNLYFGIGTPSVISNLKEKYCLYTFPNLFCSSCHIDKSISFGVGNIVTPGCIFTTDIAVGSFNVFNLNCTIGHDVEVGDCNVFNPGCNVSGGVKIENNNLMGTNSTILQNIIIGSGNVVGASSLINKHVENSCTMVGVPARQIQKNSN